MLRRTAFRRIGRLMRHETPSAILQDMHTRVEQIKPEVAFLDRALD